MLPLTMHSLVVGPAVKLEPLTQVQAMLFRPITTPEALMAIMGHTVRCEYRPNLNGAKLYTAAIRWQWFERPHDEC